MPNYTEAQVEEQFGRFSTSTKNFLKTYTLTIENLGLLQLKIMGWNSTVENILQLVQPYLVNVGCTDKKLDISENGNRRKTVLLELNVQSWTFFKKFSKT